MGEFQVVYEKGGELYIPPYRIEQSGLIIVIVDVFPDKVIAVNKRFYQKTGQNSMCFEINPKTHCTQNGYAQRVYQSKSQFEERKNSSNSSQVLKRKLNGNG